MTENTTHSLSGTRVICVGSGKGGVGKSTVTAGLAFALRDMGYSVGILDADIYGFSIPRLVGIAGITPSLKDETRIIPVQKDGVKVISMGSLVDESQGLAWRGPMLQGVLEQFVNEVEWDNPDYLLVDLPPGTGDVAISLINLLPRASYLVVTTPQATALNVATRLGIITQQANMSILGVIENMAFFECDKCGEKHYIFGKDEASLAAMAEKLGTEVLGQIPLRTPVREAADSGNLSRISDTGVMQEFAEIAGKIPERAEKAEEEKAAQPEPEKSSCSLEGG